jgi:hypothetical protein
MAKSLRGSLGRMSRHLGSPPLAAQIRDAAEVINTPFRFVQDALRFPNSERRCERRLQESLERRPNVLMVYSAPKTASTSIAAAIEASDAFTVIKVHHVQSEFFWPGVGTRLKTAHGGMRHKAIEQRTTQRFLEHHVGEIRVVSLVRDPIAFNVSNFTYFGRAYWLRTHWRSARWMPEEELARRFFSTFTHEASSVWWQREYAPTMGFDPLAEPFDTDMGWKRRISGRFDTLILRTDLGDQAMTAALRDWLPGVAIADVGRINLNEHQSPPELAQRLRSVVARHPEYVERMLELPAVRHFWSAAQRAGMADQVANIGR